MSQCVVVDFVVVVVAVAVVVASVSLHRTRTVTCPSSCVCSIHIGAVLPLLYIFHISTGLYRALLV